MTGAEGCDYCYVKRVAPRQAKNCPLCAKMVPHVHEERFNAPLRTGKGYTIFVNATSDFFDPAHSHKDRARLFDVMADARCQRHHFIILTKRPDVIGTFMERAREGWPGNSPFSRAMEVKGSVPNVRIGVSVTNQAEAHVRIPALLRAWKGPTLVSVEPIVGAVDLRVPLGVVPGHGPGTWLPFTRCDLNWVIAGGMTGPKAVPAHPEWFRTLRDQCQAAEVPFFFKGWGVWVDLKQRKGPLVPATAWQHVYDEVSRTHVNVARVGKKEAGHLLDGREHRATPWDPTPRPPAAAATKGHKDGE